MLRAGGLAVVLMLGGSALGAQAPGVGAGRLGDILGTWQSDTVGGTSALSVCDWSPQERGVICEQTITTADGSRQHTLNVFLPDSTGRSYLYYGISPSGGDAPATTLDITGHVWVYGGQLRSSDGLYYRTINDFSARDGGYVWRLESSRDGHQWTVQRRGRAVRKGPPVPPSDENRTRGRAARP